METSVKNNIFNFKIADLNFSIENFELLSIFVDSLFSNVYDFKFVNLKHKGVNKTIDFDKEIFSNVIKMAYAIHKNYYNKDQNLILFFENCFYDVLNNEKFKVNGGNFVDCSGKIKQIKTKNEKYLILDLTHNYYKKHCLLKLDKTKNEYDFVCDIKEYRNFNNRYFIISDFGDIFVIENKLYKHNAIDDYNKISDVIFYEKSIYGIIKRNQLSKKILKFENDNFTFVKSNSNKIFNLNNLILYDDKETKIISEGKETKIIKREEIVDTTFILEKETSKTKIYSTNYNYFNMKNLLILNKEKNEISIFLIKKKTHTANKKIFFTEQGKMYYYDIEKEELSEYKINNTNYEIDFFDLNKDKIYLIETKGLKSYLLIVDILNNKIIKETNPNTLCYINSIDYDYLDNITETQMQKEYMKHICTKG